MIAGRSIDVVLLPSPGPILITDEESGGVDAIEGTLPAMPATDSRDPANAYLCNGRVVLPLLDARYDDQAVDIYAKACPSGRSSGSTPERSSSAAATSTASPSRCPPDPIAGEARAACEGSCVGRGLCT